MSISTVVFAYATDEEVAAVNAARQEERDRLARWRLGKTYDELDDHDKLWSVDLHLQIPVRIDTLDRPIITAQYPDEGSYSLSSFYDKGGHWTRSLDEFEARMMYRRIRVLGLWASGPIWLTHDGYDDPAKHAMMIREADLARWERRARKAMTHQVFYYKTFPASDEERLRAKSEQLAAQWPKSPLTGETYQEIHRFERVGDRLVVRCGDIMDGHSWDGAYLGQRHENKERWLEFLDLPSRNYLALAAVPLNALGEGPLMAAHTGMSDPYTHGVEVPREEDEE